MAANRLYQWGLDAYRNMQFEQAMSLFKQACEVVPDNASKVFIMRCKYYLNNEPEADQWEGIWDL